MAEVKIKPLSEISLGFNMSAKSDSSFEDKYHYQNKRNGKRQCRQLTSYEIEVLVKNNNVAEDWNLILVTDRFDPNLVKNCEFFGHITIGDLTDSFLEFHDLRLPVGLNNSTIISCDIGDNVVIRDVHYLSHYIIGNKSILFNISEMLTTPKAKFGNGIIKDNDAESSRIWIEIANENGKRAVLPFVGMITADAYIWSKYRDDEQLIDKLKEITINQFDLTPGYYGEVGSSCVIKNCSIIKDSNIGANSYIKGANKLKNITILSSKDEPSQIGEGVELVNGIVGYASKIFYGSKAVRFITGRNTQLKYGARLINSILGDNSTVSCCELLNNLIFPFHEQHHNNSFLISSTIMGQSNIAAGATIGSNHNSRAADGELIAGRGFWPGLCTNFKFNSKFASFMLVAKGAYENEMEIIYPFSLVANNPATKGISIIPGYWFLYNMYALIRNEFKYKARDLRFKKVQKIETSVMAPDTISEIFKAIERLEFIHGDAINRKNSIEDGEYSLTIKTGRRSLSVLSETNPNDIDKSIETIDRLSVKNGIAKIIKPEKGWAIYKKVINYFGVITLVTYLTDEDELTKTEFFEKLKNLESKEVYTEWVNVGGQLMPKKELDKLKTDIKSGKLGSWEAIHKRYDKLWADYPQDKARYALYTLKFNNNYNNLKQLEDNWESMLIEVNQTLEYVYESAYSTRQKDYDDYYRSVTTDNEEEKIAVIGDINKNEFLVELKKQIENINELIDKIK